MRSVAPAYPRMKAQHLPATMPGPTVSAIGTG
jgi:hypothetical protein